MRNALDRTPAGVGRRPRDGQLTLTRGLAVASVVVLGLGGSLADRALVATPAWKQLGAVAWANYSRHADLGNGLIVYPIWGIASWALVLATAISYRFDRGAPRAAASAIYLAALASIGAAATTEKAAPIMQSIGSVPNSSPAVEQAFTQFTLWGVYVRGALFALAFLASVWGVVALHRPALLRDGAAGPRSPRKLWKFLPGPLP